MKRRCAALGLLAALAASGAAAAERVQERTGYAYHASTGELLYLERHRETWRDGRRVHSQVDYLASDGSAFASKRVDFAAGAWLPAFELSDTRIGHLERARPEQARYRVEFRRTHADALREAALPAPRDAIADAGFDQFIVEHWDALLGGATLERPFLVPSMLRFVEFRIRLRGALLVDGEDCVQVRIEPASGLLRMVAAPIDLLYRRDDASLRRYAGVSNIRGLDGRNLKVRIEFPRPLALAGTQD